MDHFDDFDQAGYLEDDDAGYGGCEHGIKNCVYCSEFPVVWVVDYPNDITKSKAFLSEQRAIAEYEQNGSRIWCYNLDTDS